MAAEFPLPVPPNPVTAVFYIWDFLSFVAPIPSPLDLIVSLFAGRPTMQATYDVATGLITQPSPALVLLGIGATFDLQNGIPLSTGNPNPVFGNYFEQAVQIESLIRFSSTDPNSLALSATTLQECLYESGNPGQTANATIAAVNQAWTSLSAQQQASIKAAFVGQPAPTPAGILNPPEGALVWSIMPLIGSDPLNPGTDYWVVTDQSGKSWSYGGPTYNYDTTQAVDGALHISYADGATNTLIQQLEVTVINGNPPSAPQPPPPPPPSPPGSAQQNIQLEVAQGQIVVGTAILGACVTGGPNPNAHIGWQIDGVHAAGPTAAPTYDGTTTQCYNQAWNSTQVGDGSHTLSANWWTQNGILIASASVTINVQNGSPSPTPPLVPPPPPLPPPPPPCTQFTSPPAGDYLVGTITISLNSIPSPATYANIYLLPIQSGPVQGAPPQPKQIATIPPNFAQFDSTTFADGEYSMQAKLFNAAHQLVCQHSINVTIQNHAQPTPPPTPPPPPPPVFVCPKIVSPPDGDFLVGTVTIYYDYLNPPATNAGIHLTDAAGVDHFVGLMPPNFFQFDSTRFANGTYTLALDFVDATGKNLCQQSITVTISNQKPPTPPPPPKPGPCPDLTALSALTGSASAIAGVNTDPSTFGVYTAGNVPGTSINLFGGPLLDNATAAAMVKRSAASSVEAGPNGAANLAANNYYLSVAALNPTAYLAAISQMRGAPSSTLISQLFNRVDGACPLNAPTSAEVIQWAAAKWGINPLLGYADATNDGDWDQTAIGDNGLSPGLFQVADSNSTASPFHAWPMLVGLPIRLALVSTPFNADFFFFAMYQAFNGLKPGIPGGSVDVAIQTYATGTDLSNFGYANIDLQTIVNSGWLKYFPAGMAPPSGAPTLVICQPPPPPPTTPPPPPPPPTTPPPPPTTCTDPCAQAIDADVQAINASLQALIKAIQGLPSQLPPPPTPPGSPPPPVVNVPPPDLTALSSALSTIAGCVCPALEDIAKAISTAAANPAPPPTIDLSALIAAIKEVYSNTPANQQIINAAATLGTIDPAVSQSSSSSFSVHWDPGRFHPKIAKWLADSGLLGGPGTHEWAQALERVFIDFFNWFKDAALTVWPDIASGASALGKGIADNFGTVFNGAAALETDLPKLIFEWTLQNALPPGQVTADNVEDDAFKLLGGAFLVGQGVHLLAELAGYLKYPASSVWAHNAEMLIELLGYKEILHSFHGAFFPVAVRERAKQRYNKQYAPYIANSNTAYTGFSRGKITLAQRDTLLNLNGRDPDYIAQEQAIRYRPISPFMLARGFRNRAPSPDLLNQVITDQGITPEFHDTLEQIIIDSCYQNLEQGLENKVLAAAGKGVMTLDAAVAQVQALGWDDKAVNLVKQAALIDQQSFIVEEVRREVIDGIKSGGMTPDQGSGLLQAAGAAQWLIDHTISLANAEAAMRAAEKIESEELRTQHKTLNDTMAALEAQYLAGNLSLTGFTAAAEVAWFVLSTAYEGLGASAAQVQHLEALQQVSIAATVTRMQALQQGRVVNLFGLQKDRADAQLLTAQVNSIKEMYLRADTTLLATQSALQNLGISQDWITALTTRWDAQLQKKGALAS